MEQLKPDKKIIVLDDDPTGVQTVHDISVFTNWTMDSLRMAFNEQKSMFFILTNSRGMTRQETMNTHQEICKNIMGVSKESGKDFIIVSRSDSTLRGHYPLETEIIRQTLAEAGQVFDGEILIPFFAEGGRITVGNVHYVKEKEVLTPVGMTEFAQDKTFGFENSHMGKWIAEKTDGLYPAENVVFITIDELRGFETEKITNKLMGVSDFNKIVVNAECYGDIEIFTACVIKAINEGKRFVFRTAASFTKVIGNVTDKPLLTKADLCNEGDRHGGLIIVGSHVKKTTEQLAELQKLNGVMFVEFNQHLVLHEGGLEDEITKVSKIIDEQIPNGVTVAVFTKRERIDFDGSREGELIMSKKIADAITGIVENVTVRPKFLIAKGGITSSDIGTKALMVRRATVAGQIAPGIPVWLTGAESKFKNMPYIIFPGNVGEPSTLMHIVELLMRDKPVIAILLGDYAGIGPEIVAKVAASGKLKKHCRPVIIGSSEVFRNAAKELCLDIPYMEVSNIDKNADSIQLLDLSFPNVDTIKIGELNKDCGKACIEMIETAVKLYTQKEIDGVCIAPLNKAAMKLGGLKVESELELFHALLGSERAVCEVNMLEGVWTFRTTSHIPLKNVSEHLTIDKICAMIDLANETLKKAGIQNPRIAVSALNPHAGENGLCGREEIEIIAPAIELARKSGADLSGPISSDIVFIKAFNKQYDAVVTLFHDQGQIALKLKGFENGITIFGGIDIPVTTTGHGSAYDIAGKKIADIQSFINALEMVCKMA